MNCTPSTIIEASKCYCGLTAKEDSAVAIYLLCTWANQEGGPVTCGTPSDVIQISGAGSGDVNGIYVRNPILPNTYNSHDDAQAKIVVTAGNATIFYGFAGFERYYSTAEDFPCTWTIGPDGTLPVPTGQWLSSPPVAWAPANEPVTWQDSGGAHVGDLPTFLATANFPSVNSLVFGATGNLTSLTGLKYLPSLATVDCNTNALTSLDCTNCTALTTLNCSLNASLTALTLTGCTALTTLDCSSCALTALDVSTCTAIVNFNCYNNLIETLDLHNCVQMDSAECDSNVIGSLGGSLNVTGLSLMTILDCKRNQFPSIVGISTCTALSVLDASYGGLTAIDLSACTLLTSIGLSYNTSLASLNVTGCSIAALLNCSYCALTTLDVSTCTSLNAMFASYNSLTSCVVLGAVNLTNILLDHNSMNSAAVDTVLCNTDTNGSLGGNLRIDSNSAPTPAGLVCSASLDPGKGWSVVHD